MLTLLGNMQLDGVATALQAFGRPFAGGESGGLPLSCVSTRTYDKRSCASRASDTLRRATIAR